MDTVPQNNYLLSETAMRIWQTNDADGEDQMLICISSLYKEKWFKSFIYESTKVPAYRMRDLAEEAFYTTWYRFNEKGKEGKIKFTEIEYTGYLKQALHRTFIRLLTKEIKEKEEKTRFARYKDTIGKNGDESQDPDDLAKKVEQTLQTLPPESAELMKWRYVQKLSYSIIAQKMKILEASCKQKLYRAKKEFIESWKQIKD